MLRTMSMDSFFAIKAIKSGRQDALIKKGRQSKFTRLKQFCSRYWRFFHSKGCLDSEKNALGAPITEQWQSSSPSLAPYLAQSVCFSIGMLLCTGIKSAYSRSFSGYAIRYWEHFNRFSYQPYHIWYEHVITQLLHNKHPLFLHISNATRILNTWKLTLNSQRSFNDHSIWLWWFFAFYFLNKNNNKKSHVHFIRK